jgi:hypothetical protein
MEQTIMHIGLAAKAAGFGLVKQLGSGVIKAGVKGASTGPSFFKGLLALPEPHKGGAYELSLKIWLWRLHPDARERGDLDLQAPCERYKKMQRKMAAELRTTGGTALLTMMQAAVVLVPNPAVRILLEGVLLLASIYIMHVDVKEKLLGLFDDPQTRVEYGNYQAVVQQVLVAACDLLSSSSVAPVLLLDEAMEMEGGGAVVDTSGDEGGGVTAEQHEGINELLRELMAHMQGFQQTLADATEAANKNKHSLWSSVWAAAGSHNGKIRESLRKQREHIDLLLDSLHKVVAFQTNQQVVNLRVELATSASELDSKLDIIEEAVLGNSTKLDVLLEGATKLTELMEQSKDDKAAVQKQLEQLKQLLQTKQQQGCLTSLPQAPPAPAFGASTMVKLHSPKHKYVKKMSITDPSTSSFDDFKERVQAKLGLEGGEADSLKFSYEDGGLKGEASEVDDDDTLRDYLLNHAEVATRKLYCSHEGGGDAIVSAEVGYGGGEGKILVQHQQQQSAGGEEEEQGQGGTKDESVASLSHSGKHSADGSDDDFYRRLTELLRQQGIEWVMLSYSRTAGGRSTMLLGSTRRSS